MTQTELRSLSSAIPRESAERDGRGSATSAALHGLRALAIARSWLAMHSLRAASRFCGVAMKSALLMVAVLGLVGPALASDSVCAGLGHIPASIVPGSDGLEKFGGAQQVCPFSGARGGAPLRCVLLWFLHAVAGRAALDRAKGSPTAPWQGTDGSIAFFGKFRAEISGEKAWRRAPSRRAASSPAAPLPTPTPPTSHPSPPRAAGARDDHV